MTQGVHSGTPEPSRRSALRFIVLLGIVSLFADMTYEGARGIMGPYLALLGASATVVGLVAGAGELLGYGLRALSGYVSDRTGRYWAVTIAGYALNLCAVPMLALAGRWDLAVALMLLERAGRAIRAPARDAMLSHAASRTGLGWGFGLHEALDQIGAVVGPLAVGAVLAIEGDYRAAFAALAIPAVFSLGALAFARHSYPRPHDFALAPPALSPTGLSRRFWLYLAASGFIAAGFADFSLIAFHLEKTKIVGQAWIPVLYSLAMAADALAALALGRLFDRLGIGTVILAVLVSLPAAPLAFLGGPAAVAGAMVLWGIGMGAQESVVRAAIAALSPAERRGTAYGLFNGAYGLAWFLGSALLGSLYDFSIEAVAAASLALQALSLPILWRIVRRPLY